MPMTFKICEGIFAYFGRVVRPRIGAGNILLSKRKLELFDFARSCVHAILALLSDNFLILGPLVIAGGCRNGPAEFCDFS